MSHSADARRMLDDRGYEGPLVRGQNPAMLMEKAVRDRIVGSYYWQEQCFGLNTASLIDRAVELTYVGGTSGQQKPTPFLCLAFKLLQLNPGRDIIAEYLEQKHFKYLRALAAFYVRLTYDSKEVYQTLEPLLEDSRKLKRRRREAFDITYIDQFVDELLTKDRICATSLWKIPSRQLLEDLGVLEERESPLAGELDDLDADALDGREEENENGESDEEAISASDGDKPKDSSANGDMDMDV